METGRKGADVTRLDRIGRGLRRAPSPPAAEGRAASGRGWDRVSDVLGADGRSLAAFRIALAAIVLIDLAGRATNLRVHYSDEGILPRELLLDGVNDWRWSLHLANGSVAFQGVLFGIAAVAALGMLVGYRTRVMTVVVWALVASVQVRNPLVLSGADTLLRVLLFWAMLLPLGAWWSVDRARAERAGMPVAATTRFVSVATIGLFLQIAFMYWFTAALKTGAAWREDGTALYYALGAAQITKPLGEYLHQFPTLLQILTVGSLGLEVVAPILLFVPVFGGRVRTAAALTIMAFHLGIYLTLDIGVFPLISAFCMVSFFPTWVWDTALPAVRAAAPTRIAEAGARVRGMVIRPVHAGRPLLGSLGSVWRGVTRSVVVGPALAAIAPSGALAPYPAGDGPAAASAPSPPARPPVVPARSAPVTNLFAALCLLFVFGWNMATVTDFVMPRSSFPIAYGLGLYQRWNMFAPQPPRATSWYVVRGVLENGRQLDLLTPIVQDDPMLMRPLSWERPANIAGDLYKDKYWRKYLSQIVLPTYAEERRAYAAFTCRTWNASHPGPEALRGITIVSVVERTLPEYQESPPQRNVIAQYQCT